MQREQKAAKIYFDNSFPQKCCSVCVLPSKADKVPNNGMDDTRKLSFKNETTENGFVRSKSSTDSRIFSLLTAKSLFLIYL